MGLVACIVAGCDPPDDRALRQWLAQVLPIYMILSAFVGLDALPLTSTGKVNRRVLSASAEVALSPASEAARTNTEEVLTQIWRKVLGRDTIGIHDDFFELGGHSLAAIRIAAMVREAFCVGLPARALFDKPTIAELADAVSQAACVLNDPLVPSARSVPRGRK